MNSPPGKKKKKKFGKLSPSGNYKKEKNKTWERLELSGQRGREGESRIAAFAHLPDTREPRGMTQAHTASFSLPGPQAE